MGYDTTFSGVFNLDKQLTQDHAAYLSLFANTRRMKRASVHTDLRPDPIRTAVGLPVGVDGGYFVGGNDYKGQEHSPDVLEYNAPPAGQPSLWCHWLPSASGMTIVWDETEKFYEHVDWIRYLIVHFLEPWGYIVNGEVEWQGEDKDDHGVIKVVNNTVDAKNLEPGGALWDSFGYEDEEDEDDEEEDPVQAFSDGLKAGMENGHPLVGDLKLMEADFVANHEQYLCEVHGLSPHKAHVMLVAVISNSWDSSKISNPDEKFLYEELCKKWEEHCAKAVVKDLVNSTGQILSSQAKPSTVTDPKDPYYNIDQTVESKVQEIVMTEGWKYERAKMVVLNAYYGSPIMDVTTPELQMADEITQTLSIHLIKYNDLEQGIYNKIQTLIFNHPEVHRPKAWRMAASVFNGAPLPFSLYHNETQYWDELVALAVSALENGSVSGVWEKKGGHLNHVEELPWKDIISKMNTLRLTSPTIAEAAGCTVKQAEQVMKELGKEWDRDGTQSMLDAMLDCSDDEVAFSG